MDIKLDKEDCIKFGVKLYTRNFDSINKKFRSREPFGTLETIVMKCLYYSAVEIYDTTVYRGTKEFSEIVTDSFISTSTSKTEAIRFQHKKPCCLFTINIKNGSSAVPILDNTFFPDEKEIVLLPDSIFIATGKTEFTYISPDYIPDVIFSNTELYLLNLTYNFTKAGGNLSVFENIDETKLEYISDIFFKENLNKRLHLEKLFFIDKHNMDRWLESKNLKAFKNCCKNAQIEEATFDCSKFPFIVMLSASSSFPLNIEALTQLEWLYLQSVNVGNLSSNLNLKNLTISRSRNIISTADLSSLINLRILKLEYLKVDNSSTLELPKLLNLTLSGCRFTKNVFKINCPEIKTTVAPGVRVLNKAWEPELENEEEEKSNKAKPVSENEEKSNKTKLALENEEKNNKTKPALENEEKNNKTKPALENEEEESSESENEEDRKSNKMKPGEESMVSTLTVTDAANPEKLRKACKSNDIKAVEYLVQHGADVNFRKGTPLAIACYKGNMDIVKCLVENGANVNLYCAVIKKCRAPIIEAYKAGHKEITMYLIQNGADVNIQKTSILSFACYKKDLEMVKFLVQHGANVNSSIGMAVWVDDLDIVKYLVENGADIHDALTDALKYGRADIVKYLQEKGK